MRRSRRSSKTLHTGGADTPIPDQPYRDPRTIHSIASLIRGKNKLLVLENPDTVEIYKLGHSTAISNSNGKDGIYLPVLKKSSSLTSIKSALSQSCSYLYDKRRGSFSSVTSQRTQSNPKTESFLREQREARKSNVVITMTYLGQGHRGSILEPTQDELKVLQQVNGGENICVFKGLVSPREQFQFVSQRHRGFPFSITLYINGIMVARFSSCCEYRYAPGFQQGRKSCFRLIWLAGGIPCYRCTSLRNKHSSCHQMSATNERLILPLEQNPANNTKPESTIRSSPSPPLFIPVKPVKESARRLRKCIKECRGGSTDSEGPAVIKETSKRNQRRGQTNLKSNKCNTAAKKMDEGRRGTEGTAEVSQQSKVADSCEDQASSVSQEETVTCSVREQPPSQETSRVHGEHSAAAAIPVSENQSREIIPDLQITFGLSAYGMSLNI
ncbi:glutamate-rich protein 3 isoform X2 [Takifugu flavidus]|nr:glutamate-rich protein 3 isoform X2 [Takifugu flavidus]